MVGLSIGADLPVSLALIAEEAPPQHKGRMIALSGLLWAVGIITATLLATVATQFGQTGARLLYGHLVLVAAIVLTLRTTLRESAEWTAAREQKGVTADGPAEEIRLGALRQLCTRPLLATLLATGLYYALWNLGANTNGQFGDFLWVKLTDHTVQSLTTLKAAAIPFAVAALLIFMRVADRPARRRWFLAGTLLALTGYALPVLVSPTPFTLAALLLLTAIGAGFSGETMYKVWSQELVPTLLRGTVQGVTMAFARLLAAAFAVITPSLATGNSRALFSLNLAFALAAAVIGLLWIPRLPAAAAALTRTEPETAGIQQSPSAAPAMRHLNRPVRAAASEPTRPCRPGGSHPTPSPGVPLHPHQVRAGFITPPRATATKDNLIRIRIGSDHGRHSIPLTSTPLGPARAAHDRVGHHALPAHRAA